MRNLKFTVGYEGTEYVGWQRQSNGVSIQGCLEDTLAEIEGKPVTVVGAGRTDAGVHALGQVASVRLRHEIPPDALVRAVNARLPGDIRITNAEVVADSFHARFDATAKCYEYRLHHGEVVSPFLRRYVWHLRHHLDIARMMEAANVLVGEHDFAAFHASGGSARSSVRTLFRLTIHTSLAVCCPKMEPSHAETTVITVRGGGFLRHMVRVIVGTLVEVGRGRLDRQDVLRVLAEGDRRAAGPTAPPQGLVLTRVDYA